MSSPTIATSQASSATKVMRLLNYTTGSVKDIDRRANGHGPDSLEDMALRCILRNLDSLDHTHLASIPLVLRRKIWREATMKSLNSLRTWKMFVRAYAQEQELSEVPFANIEKSINIGILFSPQEVGAILKHFTAPNFEWLVHLAIADCPQNGGWCVLTELSNLASLMIYNTTKDGGDSGVTDRVMKAWATAAKEEGVFSQLRVLFLHNCRNISEDAFQFLDALPALTLCHFNHCNIWVRKEFTDWEQFYPQDDKNSKLNDQFDELYPSPLHILKTHHRASLSLCPEADEADKAILPALMLYHHNYSYGELHYMKREDSVCYKRISWKQGTKVEKSHEAPPIEEPLPKKRKVRASKEKSIGDLLGDMGG